MKNFSLVSTMSKELITDTNLFGLFLLGAHGKPTALNMGHFDATSVPLSVLLTVAFLILH